jgi:hypothetical protein
MEWPLRRPALPVAETPTWSLYYLAAGSTPFDPTMVWGTDLPTDGLESYLKRTNANGNVLILPSHVLIWAVGRCLREHPEFNRRIVHRRLYDFKQVNILMPVQGGKHGPELCLVCEVDRKPLADIAREIWRHGQELAKGVSIYQRDERIFRFLPGVCRSLLYRLMLKMINGLNQPAALWGHRACRAGTMVNYLGQRGAAPMRTFKPSRFPSDVATLNVTMGPTNTDGPNGPVAPLFVRGDHRVIDAYQLGQFVGDLRRYLMDPALLET